jgi:hypothetical protein
MLRATTAARDRTLNTWHPASKALVAVALVALPYLAWTSLGEAPAAVAVGKRPAVAGTTPAAAPPELLGEITLARLPPIEQFATMLERPLFSSTRRPAEPLPEPVEEALEVEPEPEIEPLEQGAPAIRFVGTVGQTGAMTALVVREGEEAVAKLIVGDVVEGWRVAAVTTSQLVIEHEAERLVLTILE